MHFSFHAIHLITWNSKGLDSSSTSGTSESCGAAAGVKRLGDRLWSDEDLLGSIPPTSESDLSTGIDDEEDPWGSPAAIDKLARSGSSLCLEPSATSSTADEDDPTGNISAGSTHEDWVKI